MDISDDVLDVLSNRLTIQETGVVIQGQLDRKLYVKVNEVLAACGGKWNRKAKAHLFGNDPRPLLALAVSTGQVVTDRDLGFFATPAKLARETVAWADVQPGHLVLEPSAGGGAFVVELLACGVAEIIAIELDEKRAAQLQVNQVGIHDWGIVRVVKQDFMDFEPEEPFDRVVMNPPFARVGKGDHIDHVRHAFGMLATGGVLVAILPSSIQFRQDRRHTVFRNEVEHCGVIQPLPANSFAPATGVNTVSIRMVKP